MGSQFQDAIFLFGSSAVLPAITMQAAFFSGTRDKAAINVVLSINVDCFMLLCIYFLQYKDENNQQPVQPHINVKKWLLVNRNKKQITYPCGDGVYSGFNYFIKNRSEKKLKGGKHRNNFQLIILLAFLYAVLCCPAFDASYGYSCKLADWCVACLSLCNFLFIQMLLKFNKQPADVCNVT